MKMAQAKPPVKVSELFQVGIVVRDLDKSMKDYETLLGINSWKEVTIDNEFLKFTYHGKPVEHSFKAAFTMLGSLMVELLQPLEGDSIYRDFLNEQGEGLHHLGHVRVDDLDEAVQALEKAGFPCIETGGDTLGFHSWAYVDTTSLLGYILELSTGFDPRDMFKGDLSEDDLRDMMENQPPET
jgi:catechol 2,3-dioxygenase-like lactoylglutathione lyase family enzyme